MGSFQMTRRPTCESNVPAMQLLRTKLPNCGSHSLNTEQAQTNTAKHSSQCAWAQGSLKHVQPVSVRRAAAASPQGMRISSAARRTFASAVPFPATHKACFASTASQWNGWLKYSPTGKGSLFKDIGKYRSNDIRG